MKINLSIYCHMLGQSAILDVDGNEVESLLLEAPNFKVSDPLQDKTDLDCVLLSAALISMPENLRLNLQTDYLRTIKLTSHMVEIHTFDSGITSDTHRATISISYLED